MDLYGTNKKMKIIISGGWGYANLGDDAILLSTIDNILKIQPNTEIVVLSANVYETYYNLHDIFPQVKIIDSFHSLLFGYQKCLPTKILNTNRINKTILKVLNRINIYLQKDLSLSLYNKKSKVINFIDSYCNYNYKQLFKTSNLFLMSGGGFLNDWIDIDVSKYYEVSYAKRYGLPIAVLGQTIGPFRNSKAKSIVQETLKMASMVIFRDTESYNDFKPKMKDKNFYKAMPDIATSSIMKFSKNNTIVLIPFNKEIINKIDKIAENLRYLHEKSGLKIIITVSQLWPWTIDIAKNITIELSKRNIDSELKIPQSYCDLQEIVGKANLVISQNLHGLIMSYRAGTPIISLNGRRKFITFMQKIHQSNSILLPNKIIKYDEFYNKYVDSLSKPNFSELFKREVHNIFVDLLKEI